MARTQNAGLQMKAWARIPLLFATAALIAAIAATAVVTGAYLYVEPGLPEAEELRDVRFQTPLSVYSRDRELMQQFGQELRTPADIEAMPERLVRAVIAAEDDRFYEHDGIDFISTARAILNYGLSLVTGREGRVAGGSTITQQITRTTDLLPRDYAIGRKVSEIFLAYRIEREFTKDEILEIYLNTYFFGQRSYGVVSAARTYFNKELADLTLSEAAIIAGIPTAPSVNNPYYSPENAGRRRAYVLRRMFELGYIDAAERDAALAEPIEAQRYGLELELDANYVAQMAYEWCLDRFGKSTCDTTGLSIVTTVDSRLQRAANQALRDALDTYDRNHGYRGPVGHLDFAALGLTGEAEPSELDAETSPTAILDTLLTDYPDLLDTETAVVTAVSELFAEIYLPGKGPVTLGFDAVAWARRYINENRVGSTPSAVGDVLAVGDIIRVRRNGSGMLELTQIPDIQGAFVSVDPFDGAVVALVGGYSFQQSPFNRVTQALRQPGSSFKPFFYLSALARGYTLASVINDAPNYECSEVLEECRSVENYEDDYFGENRLRDVLIRSLNASADRVIRDIGASYAANYVERFGFNPRPEERNASLALGSLSITPLAMANAYSILANGGYAVGIRPDPAAPPAPYFVERVLDADGRVLYDASLSVEHLCAEPEAEADAFVSYAAPATLIGRPSELFPPLRCAQRVESAQRIYLITDVLKDVVRTGSGRRAGEAFPRRTDLAGKTGTTNGPRDAWFAGFNADIVAIARVGFDDDMLELGSGEQGGRTAIPAWIDFMKVALDGQPEHALPRPPGIVEHRIDPESGLIAADCNRDTIWEIFLNENVPQREPDCFSSGPSPDRPGGGSGRLFE